MAELSQQMISGVAANHTGRKCAAAYNWVVWIIFVLYWVFIAANSLIMRPSQALLCCLATELSGKSWEAAQ